MVLQMVRLGLIAVLLAVGCGDTAHEGAEDTSTEDTAAPMEVSGPSCVETVTIARTEVTGGEWIGERCQGDPPTNCLDGDYVQFDGECFCAARCDTLGATLGQACDSDATFICRLLPDGDSVPRCISFEWKVCEV